MVKAMINDVVIAQSDETVVVEGNHYFPRSSVQEKYLLDSDTTTTCVWKGQAQYHSLSVNGDNYKDAAWYYPEPSAKAAAIKDHLAFSRAVQVSE